MFGRRELLNSMFGFSPHRKRTAMPDFELPSLVRLRGATRRHVTAAGSFYALDHVDLDPAAFYRRLADSAEPPTTSQPFSPARRISCSPPAKP